ncbi:MAG: hypothetical protein HYY04_01730 [Chloroflexi bacterium]|nr:hypothetical protein [Chloroflexota bacterium]
MESEWPDLVTKLAEALVEALETHAARPASDPMRLLALGEAVGLLNLADDLQMIGPVRQKADEIAERNVYEAVSNAMRLLYTREPAGPGTGPVRSTGERRPGKRSARR